MMTYFVAHSGATLESVCRALQSRFGLPNFVKERHDSWEYAFARTPEIGFNVTRSEGTRTIETWMEGCPSGAGVNFQIIAEYDVEPADLVAVLESALGAEARRCGS